MAGAPRVSVLVPACHERFFPEALASACAQEGDLEIVVCDDSQGQAIAAQVASARDDRIAYFRNPSNLGFEGNFTACFERARGGLIKFLNDDDRLRPGCVARLARAFDEHPGVALATSRRIVIDERGAAMADLPATTPLSVMSCVVSGRELGDLALVNSLNVIGEPTTVMFRRELVEREEGGLFTWSGRSFHCLADLSLWLRLLARGNAYYHATPLSEYRVHRGQEQRAATMGLDCITERLPLARQARAAGFLAAPAQYRGALERARALAVQWSTRPGLAAEARPTLDAFVAEVGQELATI